MVEIHKDMQRSLRKEVRLEIPASGVTYEHILLCSSQHRDGAVGSSLEEGLRLSEGWSTSAMRKG